MAEENFIHQNETTMEKEEKTMSLTVENLKVVLQKKEILHGISLDIGEGEFISLLGASGCGKTTLLKSIGGLLEIEQGDIRIKNTSVVGIPPEKRGTVIGFKAVPPHDCGAEHCISHGASKGAETCPEGNGEKAAGRCPAFGF